MDLKEIQARIVEILKILSDEKRRKDMARGVAMPTFLGRLKEANRPLIAELRMLEGKEKFLSNHRQARISSYVGIGSVAVGIVAILVSGFIAFWVPQQQRIEAQHSEIQAVYKNLVTNQDIFISNSNNVRNISSSNQISDLPEFYIEDDISDDARKIIQDTFGLVQYRFLLYYLQQTELMNEEIEQIRAYFIITSSESFGQLNPTAKYIATMDYLQIEEMEGSKFNYQKDTECLQYFFEYNFPYLTIDGRGKVPECSYDSLNRLFYHFGFLPDDTPKWLLPKLREALNQRETGLGDRIIGL